MAPARVLPSETFTIRSSHLQMLSPIAPAHLPALLRAMPKAELHMHIEGALEPELMFALAQRNGVALPYASIDAVREAYVFDDLQHFLDIYQVGTTALRKEQDFFDMADAYLARARTDNVMHAEIFFDTQTYTDRGINAETVINGLYRACSEAPQRHGMTSSLILCFLRHRGELDAFECLEQALPLRDKISAIGLAAGEIGNPPEKFSRVFARARALGFRLVAHAGEVAPAAYIWSALDALHVDRIDHGVQASGDRALIERLARDRIPLTICPLSNVKLKVFPTLKDHNLRTLMDAGVVATVNSDDPSYFGGYINENFTQTFAALGMDAAYAYRLAVNSFEASFIDETLKRSYLDHVDSVFEEFAARA